jgi:hypothetical protein
MAKFDPKAKAKRQKIILAVLGVVLVGVLIFQAPTIMGMFGGGSSSTATEAASTTPAAAPAAPVTPAAATPGAPAAAVPAGTAAQLVDSDPVPEPATGQLVTFDRFETKDPFAQQVSNAPASSAPAGPAVPVDADAKAKDPAGDANQPAPDTGDSSYSVAPTAATISVNGASHEVKVGATFPETDPIFRLVSLKGGTARVGIVGGGYANGSQTVTLKKGGKPVTLMNTADGTTYVLRLVSVG